jgi:maleate isomerase
MQPVDIELMDDKLALVAPDARKYVGLITPSTDLTTEYDFARLLRFDDVGVYATRVPFANPTTPENLRAMLPDLTAAAELLVPGIALSAIYYSCTAASVVIGDAEVAEAIHQGRPGVPVVTPSGAALSGFAAMGISRISVLTPYLVETSQPVERYFADNGLDILRFACLGLDDDRDMARVSRQSIVDSALAIDDPKSEGFFISCTALPSISAIQEIETRTGKPVVTSNQASAWAILRYAGLRHKPAGFGRLFDHDLPHGTRN